jgi:hypothetical protein
MFKSLAFVGLNLLCCVCFDRTKSIDIAPVSKVSVFSVKSANNNLELRPISPFMETLGQKNSFKLLVGALGYNLLLKKVSASDEIMETKNIAMNEISTETKNIDFGSFKLPYNHVNLPFQQFLGKATIVFNMKIDDPQTVLQFPDLLEIFKKYNKEGLRVHAFPTEQGWFEPDDDETCRAKAKEYYGFGDYPESVVFDKVIKLSFIIRNLTLILYLLIC